MGMPIELNPSRYIQRVAAFCYTRISGRQRWIYWKSMPRWRKTLSILVDFAILLIGQLQYRITLLTVAVVLGLSFYFQRGSRSARYGLPVTGLYGFLLLFSLDESLHLTPLVLRGWTGVFFLLMFGITVAAAIILYGFAPTLRAYRLPIAALVVGVPFLAGMLVAPKPFNQATVNALNPAASLILPIRKTQNRNVMPNKLILDQKQKYLFISYRHQIAIVKDGGERPCADILSLATGEVTPVKISDREIVAMTFDEATNLLVLSVTQIGAASKRNSPKEIMLVDLQGNLTAHRPLPSLVGGYYQHLYIDQDRIFLATMSELFSFDHLLGSPRSREWISQAPWEWYTGAAYAAGRIFHTYVSPPLKGLLLSHRLKVIDTTKGTVEKIADHTWTGFWDVIVHPRGEPILVLNNSIFDPAEITFFNSDLKPVRHLRLPGVVRAFTADFERDRLFTAEYITGLVQVHRLSTGELLGSVDLGVGVRSATVGKDGEVYFATAWGVFRLDTQSLLEPGLANDRFSPLGVPGLT